MNTTPGPWRVTPGTMNVPHYNRPTDIPDKPSGAREEPIFCVRSDAPEAGHAPGVAYVLRFHGEEAQEANARLIAAAPTLLRALEILVRAVNVRPAQLDPLVVFAAIETARAALALARGEVSHG